MKNTDSSTPCRTGPIRLMDWVAENELWLFAPVALVLSFPNQWTPLALLPLAALWLCRRLSRGAWTVRTTLDVPIIIVLLAALLGLYPSTDMSSSIDGVWRVVLGVATYYAIVNTLTTQQRVDRWMFVLTAGCIGVALITLFGAEWDIVRLANWSFIYDRLPALLRDTQDGVAFHPRIMGMALATLFPLPLVAVFVSEQRLWRWIALITLPLMAGMIILTQSIQGVLGVAVGIGVLLVARSRWWLLGLPVAAVSAALATRLPQAQALGRAVQSPDDPLGIAVILRLDMWQRSLAMLHDMPYTGIGINTFPTVQTHFYPGYLIGPEPHAHNLYLQVALDLGVFGLAAFVCIFVVAAMMLWKIKRYETLRQNRLLALGVAASLASYLTSGTIDTFWTTKPAVLLWIVLGTAGALYHMTLTRITIAPYRSRTARWLAAVALSLIAIWAALPSHAWGRNLAVIPVQKAVVEFRVSGSVKPEAIAPLLPALRQSAGDDPTNAHLLALLGSAEAWQADNVAAMEQFKQRLQADTTMPIERYIPAGELRRDAATPKDADPRISIYRQWMIRFPLRAEPYVQLALVWQHAMGDRAQARAIVQDGVSRGAQPNALLTYYLDQLDHAQ